MSGFRLLTLSIVAAGLIGLPAADGATAQSRPRAPAAGEAQVPIPQSQKGGENFNAGKTPAQLFNSDCTGAGCHRGPQGLAHGQSRGGLAEFLREHYSSSRESASALASYLLGVPGGGVRPQMQPEAPVARPQRPVGRIPSPVENSIVAPEDGDVAPPPPPPAKPRRRAVAPKDAGSAESGPARAEQNRAEPGRAEPAKPARAAPRGRHPAPTPPEPPVPPAATAPEAAPPAPPPPPAPAAPAHPEIFD